MKTSDIYMASAIIALGGTYEKSAYQENSKYLNFYLSIPEELNLEEIEKKWVAEELLVNATKYKRALQQLKSVVHSR